MGLCFDASEFASRALRDICHCVLVQFKLLLDLAVFDWSVDLGWPWSISCRPVGSAVGRGWCRAWARCLCIGSGLAAARRLCAQEALCVCVCTRADQVRCGNLARVFVYACISLRSCDPEFHVGEKPCARFIGVMDDESSGLRRQRLKLHQWCIALIHNPWLCNIRHPF